MHGLGTGRDNRTARERETEVILVVTGPYRIAAGATQRARDGTDFGRRLHVFLLKPLERTQLLNNLL